MNADACAVIGANFGDEGKGLAVDTLVRGVRDTVVIRHNGGAQAGHTVETGEKRFVFHQLSSASFRGADTFWAQTFFPDLYKLRDETDAFRETAGFVPKIFADPLAFVTTIDDVLINMAAETKRGKNRHGSCGMGINEAVLRSSRGFGVTVGDAASLSAGQILRQLRINREQYVPERMDELGLSFDEAGEYGELLRDETVLQNFAEVVKRASSLVILVSEPARFFAERAQIVYEGAQGLLLDAENAAYAPHVTASRTGLFNPQKVSARYETPIGCAIYVMRGYVTRHGAGRLDCERPASELGVLEQDRTNVANEWQGRLRYGVYPSPEALAGAILSDADGFGGKVVLFITHLNETDGAVLFENGHIHAEKVAEHPAFRGRIDAVYLSSSRFAEDVIRLDLH
ncbi:MAG: adenylosuccinate synthetase [Clostridia bacterium]|nr:adenylosuccinate synthetase [Clostridia bacterium]